MFGIKRGFLPEVDYPRTYEPKSRKVWANKLVSEFLGTILFSYMIGLLGVRMKDGIKFEYLLSGGNDQILSRVVIGLWVAADIFICLLIFSKVSCDLNPAVSFYRWLSKENTVRFTVSKVVVQMVAAMAAAGLLILTQYLVQVATNDPLNFVSNTGRVTDGINPHLVTTGEIIPQYSALIAADGINANVQGNTAGRHFAALGGEIVGAFLLVWSIFTRHINSHGMRIFTVVILVFLGVSTLVEIKSVGWNPARALATNAAFDIASGTAEGMKVYWAHVVGPLIAVFLMYYGTVFFDRKVSKIWDKIVFWKNVE